MAKGFRITIKSFNDEVTGLCIMIKIKRPGEPFERIVIDGGGYNENEYQNLNEKLDFEPTEISHLIVTHSHYDHIFKIPFFVKNGFYNEIYCTPANKGIMKIAFEDSIKIMQYEKDKFNKRMLYNTHDVENTLNQLRGIEYNLPTHISRGVKLTFLGNGHLYGAAAILLQISCKKYEDKNVLITGDYYPTNELFKVPEIPEWVKRLPNLTIITESTYGNTSVDDVKFVFHNYITDAIRDRKNILFPVISLERLELVLYELKKMQDNGELSKSVKIFVHTELGKKYLNDIYLKSPDIINFMPENVELISKDDYETVLKYRKRKFIISSSGMADKGCVRFYLKNVLHRKNFLILFTCFTEKSTLGHKLRNLQKNDEITIDEINCKIACSVKHTSELSRHAKYEDILNFINQFNDVKNILITHGSKNIKEILCSRLKVIYPEKNIFIMNRSTGFKLDPEMNISTYTPTFLSSSKDKKENLRKRKMR